MNDKLRFNVMSDKLDWLKDAVNELQNELEIKNAEVEILEARLKEDREILCGTVRANGWKKERGDCWDINTSSILTKLIQETGRLVEHYASDLFVDWGIFERELKDGTVEDGDRFVFALRDMGVDHAPYYELRKDDRNYYRAVWFLDVSIHGNIIELVLHK
jgi:hypothetical protein